VSKSEDVFDFCEDMDCLNIFRPDDCTGSCPRFDARMQMLGSIYMVMPDDSAAYVGRLPRQLVNSPNRAANNVEPAGEYPTSRPNIPPLEQA